MASDAQLAAHKFSKLGQTGLVFSSWSEFLTMPVYTGVQVSMRNGYNFLCHPG